MPDDRVHRLVQDAYSEVARKASSCCGQSKCCEQGKAGGLSDHPVPESELGLSCGNPIAFARIERGDTVLDLGSGAGKDVFLAAQRVGQTGRVIGIDMTPEMLDLARMNAAKFIKTTGLANVEFREGKIEALPVEDATIDVVISNCVINLSPDKPQVFREVYRVLKPGGRMVISDIVLNRPLPPRLEDDPDLYAACIAGALLREEYLAAIRAAGFASVEILSDRAYRACEASGEPAAGGVDAALAGVAASITVVAVK